MRLLTLTIDFLPKSGGLARYADSLARVFAHDMTVIADVPGDRAACEKVQQNAPYVLRYEAFMKSTFPKWRGAFRILRRERPDVVIVHHVLPLGIVAWLYGLFTKTPYVVCLHGMDFATAHVRPWKRLLMRRVLTAAHIVVANSHALAKQVQQLTGREAIVCYPTPWIQPSMNMKMKKAQSPVMLASITRLVERKGIDRVLKALASMPHLHERVSYHITGVGPHAQNIKELVSHLHLEQMVTISETDDPEDLRHAFEEADIFVLPTTSKNGDTEGFGIVYLEAALFGVPSIATRQHGVDEAVIDKKTGLLVSNDDELAEAISRLVCDEASRQSLGQQAQEHAKCFTPNDQFQELQQRLYD